ncbi:T9SS type A sorting domain-containing protein [Calditrichota bacterium LG25]
MMRIIFFIITILLLLISNISARVIIVDQKGNGDFTDISTAILNAVDNDTIFVKSGIYSPIHIPTIKLTIIGESRDSTIITGPAGSGCLVDSDKDFAIENFKFTGNLHVGVYSVAYDFYNYTKKIPKLIIYNCIFKNNERRKTGDNTSGIDFSIAYDFINSDSLIDTLENRIFINNCFFDSLSRGISIGTGGVLGKKAKIQDSIKHNILTFDCRNNYYGTTDSTIIDSLIVDIKEDSLYNSGLQQEFVSQCIYIPFEPELITQKHELVKGFRYNNFINCKYAIYDFVLSYLTSIKSNHQIIKNFKLWAKIFPNPFNSVLNIKILNSYVPEKYELKVFDIKGQELSFLNKKESISNNEMLIRLNFNNLSSGIYFIKIFTKNNVLTKRCILLK